MPGHVEPLARLAAVQCTRPADTTGDAISTETLDVPSFAVSVSCAAGCEGEAGTAVCSSAGDYTLGGRAAIQCTRPASTSGYATSTETLEAPSFVISASCTVGFVGSPVAAACSSAGPYALGGCVACTGDSEFSDDVGQASCKTCGAGSCRCGRSGRPEPAAHRLRR